MSRRKRKKKEDTGLTGNEWLATFSDTMTLLLTFFILLYSFSNLDAQKFKKMASAFQSVLTGSAGNTVMDFNMKDGNVPLAGETDKLDSYNGNDSQELYNNVKSFIDKNDLKDTVEIKKDSRGVIIQLRDSELFETGKADIKKNSLPILEKLSKLIASVPNNSIVVEGHTDNVPISNYKYETNWELSTARASSVLRYFVETKKMAPARFTAAGYGEYKPIAPNDTDENRAKNRRVNIVVVANETKTKEATKK